MEKQKLKQLLLSHPSTLHFLLFQLGRFLCKLGHNSAAMLKGKLKLPAPDKVGRVFPDRLDSLVSGFYEKGHEIEGSEFKLESGEELEPVQPGELGFHMESDDDDDKERKIRQRPNRDSVTQVSVLKSVSEEEKRSDLEYELSQREINLEKLQRIANIGIPDGGGLRATAWKSRHIWKECEELSSTRRHEDNDVDGPLRRHEISHEDHPLSLGKASLWSQYFQYTEIVEQIDRDLQRTHPDLPFFSGESSISCKNREAMKNILLLFAKLNPEIRYVQGMNEVLAPIYYVFSTDPDKQNAANVEADSFSCFVRILGDSVDHFCQQLDNSSSGILATLSRLSDLLEVNDEQLWRHLELRTKVKPQFYAFRWITLLLTQEFKFESILRIWDTLLSNPFGVQDMLLRICCAMLLCVKSKLLSGDFVTNIKLLQHYPDDINVEYLLQVAKDISPDTSNYCLSL
ncbi:hypothetical protein JHK84_036915 [Glycine max]|nr:hypothetical protein JHK86_036688 [Glycine max]KAG5130518.1 hypothetical protein JHK84_036915 [Glycine max]